MTADSRAAAGTWWQRGIIYQIYPRSFADADGDGVGDLRGIIARLDYLVELGVDALWLSPVYPSPMADFGYDVADYCTIDPLFGSLADFDELLAASHARAIKVILDFVPNHTSDRHPWFVQSRSARDDPKRDWYLWHDGAPAGGPPNNWLSHFGGAAWEWDEPTQQWYLHSFLREQPDLNWRNPAVREAMFDVVRFWLARGVDGFRIDVLWLLIKDDRWRDNPINPTYRPEQSSYERLLPVYSSDRPETHRIVADLRALFDSYGERVMIGEIYLPLAQLMTYYGPNGTGAHLPFNFTLIDADWEAAEIAARIDAYERALPPGAWPNWVLGNHDKTRIATRVGRAQARVAALLVLTLRGTPTLYYGDELGMTDVAIASADVRDPAELRQPGIGVGRDPQRTPLPWNAEPGGGFTSGRPWLPLGDHALCNVARERSDPGSMLNLYRRIIALRRRHAAFTAGDIGGIAGIGGVLRYERRHGGAIFAILLNLRDEAAAVPVGAGHIVLSTYLDRADEYVGPQLRLRAAEGVVIEVSAAASAATLEVAHDG